MKAYVTDDGQTNFAVVASSRKEACHLINRAGIYTTLYNLTHWGNVWVKGQIKGTDVLFDNPGAVFRAPFMSDQWVQMTNAPEKEATP